MGIFIRNAYSGIHNTETKNKHIFFLTGQNNNIIYRL